MKKRQSKSLSFFFLICLVLVSLITAFVVANKGTNGFMSSGQLLGATTNRELCSSLTRKGEAACNAKNLCVWRTEKATWPLIGKGICESKVGKKATTCNKVGENCCTNDATASGYCKGTTTCDPTKYTCVATQPNQKLGQERGLKGTCSKQFRGATCKWTVDCTGGTTKLGYCQGPIGFQCCIPNKATPTAEPVLPATE